MCKIADLSVFPISTYPLLRSSSVGIVNPVDGLEKSFNEHLPIKYASDIDFSLFFRI